MDVSSKLSVGSLQQYQAAGSTPSRLKTEQSVAAEGKSVKSVQGDTAQIRAGRKALYYRRRSADLAPNIRR